MAHHVGNVVFTIGYGGRTLNDVLDQLREEGIEFVIDVRSFPYSKYNPDFSKARLQKILKSMNITYVFMGDTLGGRPKDDNCYTDGKVDYKKLRSTSLFQNGILRLQSALEKNFKICLMCSEGRPWDCHRSKLIGEALKEKGISTLHFLKDGPRINQEEAISKITKKQLSFFGDDVFTSRKAYR